MAMRLVFVLLWLLQGANSEEDAPSCRTDDEQCTLIEAEELSISLLQRSVAIVAPADSSMIDIGKVPVAHLDAGQQLHNELQHARQARRDVIQKWDERVATLEARLAKARLSALQHIEVPVLTKATDASPQVPPKQLQSKLYTKSVRNAQMGFLCVVALLTLFYIHRTIAQYEASRHEEEMDCPWYLNTKCLSKVLGAGGLLWLIIGMISFTELMWFTDDRRHLTAIEAFYLTAQIVTTVGYGDMTPTSSHGMVFMSFYAFTGVAIIGTLAQQMVFDGMTHLERELEETSEPLKPKLLGAYHEAFKTFMPLVTCIAFGTAFFSLYPGEEKNTFEAFYMTIVTLLSIGFGAYHPVTQVGKLVGAFWMFLGVAAMGSAIVGMTEHFEKKQAALQARARASRLFREVDKDGSGTIDKMEFLNYELVRQGMHNKTADDILKQFAALDKDDSGSLDLEEFKSYVRSL